MILNVQDNYISNLTDVFAKNFIIFKHYFVLRILGRRIVEIVCLQMLRALVRRLACSIVGLIWVHFGNDFGSWVRFGVHFASDFACK